tara:strand:- start:264 stop:551 length:288 start_codon:yes stop_codon:yes gene_type:complete
MQESKVKLESGIEVKLQEMSVDDIDYCSDIIVANFDSDNNVKSVNNVAKARTAWLRKGLVNCDDKLLKSLSDDEKALLLIKVQEFQRMGEEKPSS